MQSRISNRLNQFILRFAKEYRLFSHVCAFSGFVMKIVYKETHTSILGGFRGGAEGTLASSFSVIFSIIFLRNHSKINSIYTCSRQVFQTQLSEFSRFASEVYHRYIALGRHGSNLKLSVTGFSQFLFHVSLFINFFCVYRLFCLMCLVQKQPSHPKAIYVSISSYSFITRDLSYNKIQNLPEDFMLNDVEYL